MLSTCCLCVCDAEDRAPLALCRSSFWELPGRAELLPLDSGSVHAFSVTRSAAAFGEAFLRFGAMAVCFLFSHCTASKWLCFIMDLRLYLIVLIIFLRACAGGVAGIEADTLLVGFELHFRSFCGFFGTLFIFF